MNIPMSWLRNIVNITDDTATFVDKVTAAGVKVEGIETTGEDITRVVVGLITKLERHPDADKLWVTQVDVGKETLQIVTGADNLNIGDYIPVALHGATLAGGLKIKKSKMRGLESNGMLCSIDELGCTTDDFPHANNDGIFIFLEPHPLGADVVPIMGLAEEVLDFEILSNRPDTNAVLGIAREVAAVYNQPFPQPKITVAETAGGHTNDLITVEIRDAEKCPRYIARVVTNAKIEPSPSWMQKRLTAAGVRPVNNIVDITNYVMLEYGQPLHAFDISAVAKQNGRHAVVVRTAYKGEKITTLDGVERTLTDTTLLITDTEKPLAIAGIMGSDNTKIIDETTTILFESANFNAANIRQSAKALGMRTDASARYEKGPDPNLATACVNRAMELVEQLACGNVVPGSVDAYPTPRLPRVVPFSPANINKRLGLALDANEITDYLRRVDITVRTKNETLEAIVPTFRSDITSEVDLAEEVARFYGYNRIVARHTQLVPIALPFTPGMTPRRRFDQTVRGTLVGLGYFEALTYPFESPKVADKLTIPEGDALRYPLTIDNPLGEDYSVMRPLTIGGLLSALAYNAAKRNDTARLFEQSWEYVPHSLPLQALPQELPKITLAAYGPDVDFLSIKGDVEDLLSTCVSGRLIFEPLTLPWMHPGRTASIAYKPHPKRDAIAVGYVGELHPQVARNYEIEARACLAVLDSDVLYEALGARKTTFTPPPKFPAMTRDLAFTVPEGVTAAQCETAIRERGGALLADVTLFDVYQGQQIEAGFKSMAYSLRFIAPDRTLTDDAAVKLLTTIRANLEQKHEARFR
ncbi:MAG: phenylalanine--tRNA ligase subunit beta [Defluviitaleaceae bacterium]|nr:phenylalanine--tRNA ligase subunit beta [Defluviitaleaceae bacterium]